MTYFVDRGLVAPRPTRACRGSQRRTSASRNAAVPVSARDDRLWSLPPDDPEWDVLAGRVWYRGQVSQAALEQSQQRSRRSTPCDRPSCTSWKSVPGRSRTYWTGCDRPDSVVVAVPPAAPLARSSPTCATGIFACSFSRRGPARRSSKCRCRRTDRRPGGRSPRAAAASARPRSAGADPGVRERPGTRRPRPRLAKPELWIGVVPLDHGANRRSCIVSVPAATSGGTTRPTVQGGSVGDLDRPPERG